MVGALDGNYQARLYTPLIVFESLAKVRSLQQRLAEVRAQRQATHTVKAANSSKDEVRDLG